MDVGRSDSIMECPNVMLTRKRERNSFICANWLDFICLLNKEQSHLENRDIYLHKYNINIELTKYTHSYFSDKRRLFSNQIIKVANIVGFKISINIYFLNLLLIIKK